jgi:hypothetical protein
MSKIFYVGLGAVLGACGALVATAAISGAANPPPEPAVKRPSHVIANVPLLPPNVSGNKVTLACPATAPNQINQANGWIQYTLGGNLRTFQASASPIYDPAHNSINCLYGLSSDPSYITTELMNFLPAGSKNCIVSADNTSVVCDKS